MNQLRVPADSAELRAIAHRLRTDTWELSERWCVAAAEASPGNVLRGGGTLARFGEIPAFIAALARFLERIAEAGEHVDTPEQGDVSLREAAAEHARLRATAGYSQRDMLAEFVALRRVLWEHFAGMGADQRPTFEGERIVNLLLDSVIVEAADHFFVELTEELVRKAERDPLTGLLNRQTFHDRLEKELARAHRYGRCLTVVAIDLDAFKQVNDTLGHLAGDAVLRRLASLLTTHTREQDLVGRLGGDEFAVALVETGMPAARDLIRRLRIHLTPARRQFGLPREFGVSFGAATFPEHGQTVAELLFAADTGLYRAKGPGRGTRMLEAGHTPDVSKLRVLVADDDPGVRALCTSVLVDEGFEVLEAGDGEAAVNRARTSLPDVILLDIAMPGMDGWEVAERLAHDERTRGIPIVMMTASASSENIERADQIGAVDFLAKPFDPDALTAALHELLELSEQMEAGGAVGTARAAG